MNKLYTKIFMKNFNKLELYKIFILLLFLTLLTTCLAILIDPGRRQNNFTPDQERSQSMTTSTITADIDAFVAAQNQNRHGNFSIS